MIFEFNPKHYRFAVEIGIPKKLERLDKIPRPKPNEEVACAINWNVFDWVGNSDGYGEIEQDGVQYKPASKAFPSISFKDGKLSLGDLPGAQVGVGIAMTLVIDGKIDIRNPAKMGTGKNKRTACGQKANGNILFVTVDSMTTEELARYMLSLGCVNAFQGDSGGSTGIYINGKLYDQGRAIAAALVAYKPKEVNGVFIVEKDIQLSKNFKLSEFVCKDGSKKVYYVPELIDRLQAMRDKLGKAITIVSGYRTVEYNAKIGGAPKSQHLEGKAADIKVSGISPLDLAKVAESVGFKGIGIYTYNGNSFLHVDVRATKSYWKDTPSGELIKIDKV